MPYLSYPVIINQLGLLYEYAGRSGRVCAALRQTFSSELLGQLLGSSTDFTQSTSAMELMKRICPSSEKPEEVEAFWKDFLNFHRDGRASGKPKELDLNAPDLRTRDAKDEAKEIADSFTERLVHISLFRDANDYLEIMSDISAALGAANIKR